MKKDIFSYGTPESVGYSSMAMETMFRELKDSQFVSHSLLVAHDGCIMAEGYFAPFTKDSFHRMYSTSKSFTATAIGCLIDDGKLSLSDPVIRFFPDKVTGKTHRYIREMTIRDLLTMATCFSGGATYSPHRDDWVDSFFTTEPDHPSGTYFSYDTSASFILDVIVEKMTGKPYLDFLKDRGLRDAGFSEDAWCVQSPDGYSWGGSGVECTTRDLARLGQIYLNKGKVGNKQIISEWFVKEAIRRQIDNNETGHRDNMHGNGYGYQIWCLPEDCFAFLGMGGQVCFASPKYNLLLAATSDEQGGSFGYAKLCDLFFRYLFYPAKNGTVGAPLPENPAAYQSLCEYTSHLEMTLPVIGEKTSPHADAYLGKTYRLDKNLMGIEWFRLDADDKEGTFTFFARGEEKIIPFAMGAYKEHRFPQTDYFGKRIRTPKGEGYRTLSAGLWTQEDSFAVRSYLIDDYLGNLHIRLAFKGKEVSLVMRKTAEWFLDEYQGMCIGHAE